MSISTEHVLVVPTRLFHELGHFQGFHDDVDRYLRPLLASGEVTYRPRDAMEQDPSFKQLIPYVIFEFQGAGLPKQVFQYTRGKGQGEQRLHAKLSIGIGGHISAEDAASGQADPYWEGMRRELEEEVRIDTEFKAQCIGLINDDETEVGRVHLGVVHLFRVAAPRVEPNESEITDAGFRTLRDLHHDRERMETWSRICFDSLYLNEFE